METDGIATLLFGLAQEVLHRLIEALREGNPMCRDLYGSQLLEVRHTTACTQGGPIYVNAFSLASR